MYTLVCLLESPTVIRLLSSFRRHSSVKHLTTVCFRAYLIETAVDWHWKRSTIISTDIPHITYSQKTAKRYLSSYIQKFWTIKLVSILCAELLLIVIAFTRTLKAQLKMDSWSPLCKTLPDQSVVAIFHKFIWLFVNSQRVKDWITYKLFRWNLENIMLTKEGSTLNRKYFHIRLHDLCLSQKIRWKLGFSIISAHIYSFRLE